MAELYPPYIEGTIPAFTSDKIIVPYTMNRTVNTKEVGGFVIKIKSAKHDTVKVQDRKAIEWSNKYAIFSIADLQLQEGLFYKIQIAYISSADQTIGIYSTVGVGKCVQLPSVQLGRDDVVEGMDKGFLNSGGNITGTFVGRYKSNDPGEKVYTYKFDFIGLDENGNEFTYFSTGDVRHDISNDIDANTSLDIIELFGENMGENFDADNLYIQYSVVTLNNYYVQTNRIKLIQYSSAVSNLANLITVTPTLNYDDAYINIEIQVSDEAIYNLEAAGEERQFPCKCVLIRENKDTGEQVKIHEYWWATPDLIRNRDADGNPQWISFKDFTIEQGSTYSYHLIQEMAANFYSQPFPESKSNIFADFEDMYLLGKTLDFNKNPKQLRIRFNPKVSSFKTTILETKSETLGGKYPIFSRNGHVEYKEFPIEGLISYEADENALFYECGEADSRIRESTPTGYDLSNKTDKISLERRFRLAVLDWLNDDEPKLFKSATEGNYIVRLMNVSMSPMDQLGRMLYSFTAMAYEVADYNKETLLDMKFLNWENKSENFIQTIEQKGEKNFNELSMPSFISVYSQGISNVTPFEKINKMHRINLSEIPGLENGITSITFTNDTSWLINAVPSYNLTMDFASELASPGEYPLVIYINDQSYIIPVLPFTIDINEIITSIGIPYSLLCFYAEAALYEATQNSALNNVEQYYLTNLEKSYFSYTQNKTLNKEDDYYPVSKYSIKEVLYEQHIGVTKPQVYDLEVIDTKSEQIYGAIELPVNILYDNNNFIINKIQDRDIVISELLLPDGYSNRLYGSVGGLEFNPATIQTSIFTLAAKTTSYALLKTLDVYWSEGWYYLEIQQKIEEEYVTNIIDTLQVKGVNMLPITSNGRIMFYLKATDAQPYYFYLINTGNTDITFKISKYNLFTQNIENRINFSTQNINILNNKNNILFTAQPLYLGDKIQDDTYYQYSQILNIDTDFINQATKPSEIIWGNGDIVPDLVGYWQFHINLNEYILQTKYNYKVQEIKNFLYNEDIFTFCPQMKKIYSSDMDYIKGLSSGVYYTVEGFILKIIGQGEPYNTIDFREQIINSLLGYNDLNYKLQFIMFDKNGGSFAQTKTQMELPSQLLYKSLLEENETIKVWNVSNNILLLSDYTGLNYNTNFDTLSASKHIIEKGSTKHINQLKIMARPLGYLTTAVQVNKEMYYYLNASQEIDGVYEVYNNGILELSDEFSGQIPLCTINDKPYSLDTILPSLNTIESIIINNGIYAELSYDETNIEWKSAIEEGETT